MPPSGYRKEQGNLVESFLKSISGDLRKEGQSFNLKSFAALEKEIKNIDQVLLKEKNPICRSVLQLTQAFYQEISIHVDETYTWNMFDEKVRKLAEIANSDVCNIKGPKLG